MRRPKDASAALDRASARLVEDHLVVLPLDALADLVTEPDVDPFAPRRGTKRAGIDDAASILSTLKRLPEDLTVRVVVPAGAAAKPSAAEAQEALHREAREQAAQAWRDAMAVRSMGLRQLPLGLVIALVSAVVAYAAAYLAADAGTPALVGLLAVVAGIAITVAWVVSWMVVEASMLDWRQAGRTAAAYELLSHARLEVVTEPSP